MSFNKYDFKISEVCHSPCHREGFPCLCFHQCCDLCGEKYLNKSNKLVTEKYIKLREETENRENLIEVNDIEKQK